MNLSPRHASSGGYTLVELIVAMGLFAIIMTLSTGAYLIMISVNRHAQAISTGIDNLSFALEDMTRTIRTGTVY
ncbi:MAG TPA: prepilin-type N-terminal cleavage/methylation domain-containing protein, partial [Candidatus Paceibacterota bacterium]|nr:prepilin-type N-terminal cleavage/methylation domain-containing protein [Candidatus Paceibacterota bacterium]